MREAAALLSIAINRNLLTGQRLPDEIRNDHSVTSGLAWADGVEEARDHCRNLFLFPVGDGQEFVNRLRAGVTPPALVSRPHHQIVVLAERNSLAFTVNFRSRGDQN